MTRRRALVFGGSLALCAAAGVAAIIITSSSSNTHHTQVPVSSKTLATFPFPQNQLSTNCEPMGPCFILGYASGFSVQSGPVLLSWRQGQLVPRPVALPRFVEGVDGMLCVPGGVCTLQASFGNRELSVSANVGQSVQNYAVLVSSGPVGHWHRISTPSPYFNGAVCLTDTRCVALLPSASALTTDGGRRWSLARLPAGFDVNVGSVDGANPVWCISSTTCLTLGSTAHGTSLLLRTFDGGAHWATAAVPPLAYNESFGCNNGVCVAEDGPTRITNDAGLRWSHVTLPSNPRLSDVTCSTLQSCVASASSGRPFWTSDAGASWHAGMIQPRGAQQGPASFSCASARDCVAFLSDNSQSDYLYATSDGGRTWSAMPMPVNVALSASSCDASGICTVLGQNEDITNPTVISPGSPSTSFFDVVDLRTGANQWGGTH